ncbi:MAG: triose-phosphate isomerase [Candidatus Portnoybacteria bacterium]|nr:triose-phosphate isomerase [Candidatus Portnoybacteria bacterium]
MKKIIIANWKMNPSTAEEAKKLFGSIKKTIKTTKNAEVLIAAPFVWWPFLKKAKLCAQNCFWEEKGPYTGEISPKMIKDMGTEYVIVGHSERRNCFNETDEIINKKLKSALNVGLVPVLCVGEKKGENAETVIENQLKIDLEGISESETNKIIVAYEPVWAIGTGDFCEQNQAGETLKFIKNKINNKIIYGGSVNGENSKGYIDVGFDGLLPGGASLKADEFIKIIKNV